MRDAAKNNEKLVATNSSVMNVCGIVKGDFTLR
jgi:hypothetical protein